ncbi:cellulose/xylan binding protein with CBM9 domain [Arcticibacter tournemirensis]|uniref:Carbohydrate-binding domain-containing protein n=1 Tax=Arcticibacter tournemirensis TaxID=699437 RepID=A0A5M9HK94_9SPHI|nr:carbohydrate-binding family 9-like protein [Arcticibacter tournemirensis]KAA8485838.1 hypothetical protein F1649_02235 [Arcticibacter tournemirensis]TQM46913.1 cellulose/xylan binding protein with CBM9 domain [Arcticibacter tournemirensis]
MKSLSVPFVSGADKDTPVEEVSFILNGLGRSAIETVSWPVHSYKPDTSFVLAYATDCFFLKYYVKEDALQAAEHHLNEPVYKDSCVEFFIAFGRDREYYNLEFNCLGSCLIAYGPERNGRKSLPGNLADNIRSGTWIGSGNTVDGIYWELTLVIPFEVFIHHKGLTLNEMECRANFYKCGDDLPVPHFLSWNKIDTEAPDFHRPEFFGNLYFE